MAYAPDYGLEFIRLLGQNAELHIVEYAVRAVMRVEEELFSITQNVKYEKEYCMTLDFDRKRFNELLQACPLETDIKNAFAKMSGPFKGPVEIFFTVPVFVEFSAKPGMIIRNTMESYVPFIVSYFKPIPDDWITVPSRIIPGTISHLMMNNGKPVGFAVEYHNKKTNELNTLYAYVCYPTMPESTEYGRVYTFNSLDEAKGSIAWNVIGGFNYATAIKIISSEQMASAEELWLQYSTVVREGFRKVKLSV